MTSIKNVIKLVMPNFAKVQIKKVREHFEPGTLAFPVVQIYINDGELTTVASFNNFLSVLAPAVKTNGVLKIEIFNSGGESILNKDIRINFQETLFFDLQKELGLINNNSPMGIISMQFIPDKLRAPLVKDLGVLSSHFFMIYCKGNDKGLSVIHPSSTLDPASPSSPNYLSSQLISMHGIYSLVLFQANPGLKELITTISLVTADGITRIINKEVHVPPRGVSKVEFLKDELTSHGNQLNFLRLMVDKLPTSSAKPMLCRVYKDGRFSMSHS